MAKVNPELPSQVLVVHVSYPNAGYVRKVESRICNHGEIVAQTYLRARDKIKTYQIRSASYVVITHNPRILKITLKQLQNTDNISLHF